MKPQRVLATLLFAMAGIASVQAYNCLYIKAETYPTGAGKVYVDQYPVEEEERSTIEYQEVSELKNAVDKKEAYIYSDAADGWQLAGYVRDKNNNGLGGDDDEQLKVNEDRGVFTPVWDNTQYDGNGNTSVGMQEALAALEKITEPTDHLYAIFTQGDAAHVAPDNGINGYVSASKLDNVPGEAVTFTALPDKGYRLAKWTDRSGKTVGSRAKLNVTAKGGETYYAHFEKGDPDEPGDDSTGIENIEHSTLTIDHDPIDHSTLNIDHSVYDLSGRRVAQCSMVNGQRSMVNGQLKKGIYIVAGRKVIINQ